ncbi:MAG: hypothetical protein ACRDG9_10275 [Actinomycetota bacterium]
MPPQTRYTKSGDVTIAYQVLGTGPRDLVLVPGWISNVEMFWEGASPRLGERLAIKKKVFERRDGRGLLMILPAKDVAGTHGKPTAPPLR